MILSARNPNSAPKKDNKGVGWGKTFSLDEFDFVCMLTTVTWEMKSSYLDNLEYFNVNR